MALVICVALIAGSLFSVALVGVHMKHDHGPCGSERKCTTCACLAAAEYLFKFLSAALIGAALISGGYSAVVSIWKPADFHMGLMTLVHRKVQFNN